MEGSEQAWRESSGTLPQAFNFTAGSNMTMQEQKAMKRLVQFLSTVEMV
jgi:hypothetical protein